MSPRAGGARSSSPGPVKVELDISLPVTSFFIENLMAPLSTMLGDMEIMAPGGASSVSGFLLIIVMNIIISSYSFFTFIVAHSRECGPQIVCTTFSAVPNRQAFTPQ